MVSAGSRHRPRWSIPDWTAQQTDVDDCANAENKVRQWTRYAGQAKWGGALVLALSAFAAGEVMARRVTKVMRLFFAGLRPTKAHK
jgi:hypothetical protein